MTPPRKPKRPSARPVTTKSEAPPPPAGPGSAAVPSAELAAGAPSEKRASRAKKARVSARRPSLPPAPVAPAEGARRGAAGKIEEPVGRSVDEAVRPTPAPSVRVPPTSAAAPPPVTQPERRGQGASNGVGAHAQEDDDEEDDIWGEAAAGPAFPPSDVHDGRAHEHNANAADETDESAPAAEVHRLARSRNERRRDEAVMLGSAQTLVSTDYYFRQYGAHGIRSLTADVDEFGFDPIAEERLRPVLDRLCKHYFRVEVDGARYLPEAGRVLMVANRAGALPWDGLVLRTALRLSRPALQPVRWLAEDSVFHYPFLGVLMNRLGAVRACPENAERLLRQDRLVAVFPEGAHGSGKLFRDRYRLKRFGRGGYVKLALKLGAPIVPTAILGAEETNPLLGRSRTLGRIVGTPYLPITPTFPWFGPAGLLPAPVKWRIVVGEPIDLSSYGPKSADDALLVHRLNEQIRAILQSLVDQAKSSRRSVLFG